MLNVAANCGMLLIWFAYLQLFLQNYRRQTRSKIVINSGASNGLDARCLISNMSSDAIYVEAITASLESGDQRWGASVTSPELLDGETPPDNPKLLTHQGPLRGGEYMVVGKFSELLDRTLVDKRGQLEELLRSLEQPIIAQIEVVADYASEDLLIGARRRFRLEDKAGAWQLKPLSVRSEQILTRSGRTAISKGLIEDA